MREVPTFLMTAREAYYLVELAHDRVVLELGCFRGRTTARMARVAKRVWTVDHHHIGDLDQPYDSLHDYFVWLEGEGVRDQVVSVVGSFDSVLPALPARFFDLVIVDGAHDVESVERDLAYALYLVALNGVVAMHDWNLPAVSGSAYRLWRKPTTIVDTLAVFMLHP